MRDQMDIIADLMEELKGAMEYGESDFDERLGRKKPAMEVVKIEGEMDPMLEAKEEAVGMDLDGDSEMGEGMEHMEEVLSPEDKLKERLQKLRG